MQRNECVLWQLETHVAEKHQYDPVRPEIIHQVAVELNEDAGNAVADVDVDGDGDADADEVLQVQQV